MDHWLERKIAQTTLCKTRHAMLRYIIMHEHVYYFAVNTPECTANSGLSKPLLIKFVSIRKYVNFNAYNYICTGSDHT